jgi:hypothetical protein
MPAAGFAEIIATWLNAEGVTALRAVRRPGSSSREFHFAGVLRRGAEENRLALVVLRGGRDLARENVVEARGSLHHYSAATGAWLISTARIHPTGREEAASEGGAPCALFGGSDLARAMERLGIGMKQHFVTLSDIDFDLLEALGDTGLQSGRPERDQATGPHQQRDRPRDRDREGGRDRDRSRGDGPDRDSTMTDAERDAQSTRSHQPSQVAEFDLLDPSIAEESRLVPEARTWTSGNDGAADGEAGESEDKPSEGSSAVRLAPAIAIGEENDEFDADTIDIEEEDEGDGDSSVSPQDANSEEPWRSEEPKAERKRDPESYQGDDPSERSDDEPVAQ